MKPLERNDQALVAQYRMLFSGTVGIRSVSITPRMGDLAAQLRATYNLKTPDALYVAMTSSSKV